MSLWGVVSFKAQGVGLQQLAPLAELTGGTVRERVFVYACIFLYVCCAVCACVYVRMIVCVHVLMRLFLLFFSRDMSTGKSSLFLILCLHVAPFYISHTFENATL